MSVLEPLENHEVANRRAHKQLKEIGPSLYS